MKTHRIKRIRDFKLMDKIKKVVGQEIDNGSSDLKECIVQIESGAKLPIFRALSTAGRFDIRLSQ